MHYYLKEKKKKKEKCIKAIMHEQKMEIACNENQKPNHHNK